MLGITSLTAFNSAAAGTNTLSALLITVLSPEPEASLAREWKNFLRATFHPLQLVDVADDIGTTCVVGSGSALRVPHVVAGGGCELCFVRRGLRLFSAADAAYVQQTLQLLRVLLSLKREIITQRAQERRRIARDLHDHVGAILLVLLNSESGSVRDMARVGLSKLRATVTALKSDLLSVPQTLEQWRAQIQSQCEACAVELRWQQPDRLDPALLPPVWRDSFSGILQEAVSNSLRHARARHVWVSITVTGAGLTLVVQDDGVGLGLDARNSGFGMRNMEERAKEVGGSVTWKNFMPRGCRMTSVIPGAMPGRAC
jgi:signal transduction histidine kinase